MDPASLSMLPAALSSSRLAPYLRDADVAHDLRRAIRLYTWNVEISAAFWGPLHALEVGLRNALHDQMWQRFGVENWWDLPRVRLHSGMLDQLCAAKRDAAKATSRRTPARPVVPPDIVAALTLGFWAGLLGRGAGVPYETQFWQPASRKAFPHYGPARPGVLSTELTTIRLFRNRIAHHEPIFTRALLSDHEKIVRITSYISPDLAQYVSSHSRVEDVLNRRGICVSAGKGTRF